MRVFTAAVKSLSPSANAASDLWGLFNLCINIPHLAALQTDQISWAFVVSSPLSLFCWLVSAENLHDLEALIPILFKLGWIKKVLQRLTIEKTTAESYNRR